MKYLRTAVFLSSLTGLFLYAGQIIEEIDGLMVHLLMVHLVKNWIIYALLIITVGASTTITPRKPTAEIYRKSRLLMRRVSDGPFLKLP